MPLNGLNNGIWGFWGIILEEKLIPQEFSDFDPSTPPVPGCHFFGRGVGGGGQNFLAYCGRCVWIWTRVRNNFVLVHGPPNLWQGPGSELRVPPRPHYGPLPVRT